MKNYRLITFGHKILAINTSQENRDTVLRLVKEYVKLFDKDPSAFVSRDVSTTKIDVLLFNAPDRDRYVDEAEFSEVEAFLFRVAKDKYADEVVTEDVVQALAEMTNRLYPPARKWNSSPTTFGDTLCIEIDKESIEFVRYPRGVLSRGDPPLGMKKPLVSQRSGPLSLDFAPLA